jgi:hypothetical protein
MFTCKQNGSSEGNNLGVILLVTWHSSDERAVVIPDHGFWRLIVGVGCWDNG